MTPDDLRSLLTEHNVSQRELARRLRVSQSTVFRWATGARDMRFIDEIAIRKVVEDIDQ